VTAAGALGKLLGFLPILAGGGSMAFMFTQGGSTSRLVMSGLMAVSMLGMSLGQSGNKKTDRKREIDAARRDYVRYLNQLRDRVRVAASRQREALVWRYPSLGCTRRRRSHRAAVGTTPRRQRLRPRPHRPQPTTLRPQADPARDQADRRPRPGLRRSSTTLHSHPQHGG